ncbi:hypothetical protein ABLI39_13770 [Pseudarthrobacter sp. B907]|uniref:hypothetical protein n=1 Tax=Pseudarthrobacter sp. B907 TaxID=3158261 RepID=UPI0032DA3D33
MSENSEFDRAAAHERPGAAPVPAADERVVDEPAAEADAGQYVEGDYGRAGVAGENPAAAPEGEYPEGDYGKAGLASGTRVGDEAGDYPEGDYGRAGATGPDAVIGEEGEYPEGDYGTAGAAGPRRTGHRAEGAEDEPVGRDGAVRDDAGREDT